MNALDEVLAAYRDLSAGGPAQADMFGVKTEHANETHRRACEEVARLRGDPDTLLGKVIKELGYGMNMPNETDIALVALWVSRRADNSLNATMFRMEDEPLTDELRERIAAVLRNLADTLTRQ